MQQCNYGLGWLYLSLFSANNYLDYQLPSFLRSSNVCYAEIHYSQLEWK